MAPASHTLLLASAVAAVAWSLLAAWRTGAEVANRAGRALLGGVAAFLLAWAAYDLATGAGLAVTWERLAAGGADALVLGGAIGLIEEGAKLAGLLLAARRDWSRRKVSAAAFGVCAGFAACESAIALSAAARPEVLARVLLAPFAHAALMVPTAAAAAWAIRRGGLAWVSLAPALAVATLLHGAGDWSLAVGVGRAGYALALVAPVLALYVVARLAERRVPVAAVRRG